MNLLLIEIILTAYLTGLIWTIQRVHYPSFSFIDASKYIEFQTFHMKRITYVVGPIMLLEFAVSAYNILKSDYDIFSIVNFILVLIIWSSTVLWTVPLHNKLMLKKDDIVILELTKSNLIRSILWTMRLLILAYIYYTKY